MLWRWVAPTVVAVAGLAVVGAGLLLSESGYDGDRYAEYRGSAAMGASAAPADRLTVRTDTADDVRRGDLVLVRAWAAKKPTVLRVIGVGGDTVRSAGDKIEVNGKVVDEDYVSTADQAPPGAVEFAADVPDGSVYLAGDVRNNAVDSRMYGDTGAIATTEVVGTVVAVNGETITPTTAFTDAGLHGAPYTDPGASRNLLPLIAGVLVAVAGLIWLGTNLLRRRTSPEPRLSR